MLLLSSVLKMEAAYANRLHGIITQDTTIWILTVVRTSDLIPDVTGSYQNFSSWYENSLRWTQQLRSQLRLTSEFGFRVSCHALGVHVAHRHILEAWSFSVICHFFHKFQRSCCCPLDEDSVACNDTTVGQWRLVRNVKSMSLNKQQKNHRTNEMITHNLH